MSTLASVSGAELPVPVIAELRYGALNSRRATENVARIDRLVASCGVLNATVVTAELYGRVRFELRRQGTPIPENDVWIASICIENDIPLWTDDRHFSVVAGLRFFAP